MSFQDPQTSIFCFFFSASYCRSQRGLPRRFACTRHPTCGGTPVAVGTQPARNQRKTATRRRRSQRESVIVWRDREERGESVDDYWSRPDVQRSVDLLERDRFVGEELADDWREFGCTRRLFASCQQQQTTFG